MKSNHWIALGLGLFLATTLAWIAMVWQAQWPTAMIWMSSAPLVLSLLSLAGLAPKAFFYGALTLMLYIAFVISQIVVAPDTRLEAALVLGTGLAYLTLLKFILQALNARRQQSGQASS